MITHDAISARLDEMSAELVTFIKAQAKERESLVENCAGLGHKHDKWTARSTWEFGHHIRTQSRECLVCGHEESHQVSDVAEPIETFLDHASSQPAWPFPTTGSLRHPWLRNLSGIVSDREANHILNGHPDHVAGWISEHN